MASNYNIEQFSNSPLELGEGPHWNSDDKKLYAVDIPAGRIVRFDSKGIAEEIFHKDGAPISVVLPIQGYPDRFVYSDQTEIRMLHAGSDVKDMLMTKIDVENVRFNDGKCDPRGRVWIGSMSTEPGEGEDFAKRERGSLYCLREHRSLEVQLEKVSLSNGMCWSLDEKRMYYIDSMDRAVYVFDYDVEAGKISNKQVLVNMNGHEDFQKKELPDGMTIDASGNLWVTMFGSGRIVNVDGQTGKVLGCIIMPTKLTTSVCFGGENLTEMYVTTGRLEKYMDEEAKKNDKAAGHIFKVTSTDPSFKGHLPNFNVRCPHVHKAC